MSASTNGVAPVIDIYAPTPKAPAKPLDLHPLSTIRQPLPAVDWVCEALKLATGGTSMVSGFGYSGKTILAQAIALAIVTGLPLFGLFPVREGKVIHIDYEQGEYLTYDRYQRLARGMGINLAKYQDDALRTVSYPEMNIDSSEAEERLLATCEGATLVIVDSLAGSCPDTEENSSKMTAPIKMLNRVANELKLMTLLIHHNRKDGAEGHRAIRGNGAIFNTVFSSFALSAGPGEPIQVQHLKERWRGTEIESFGLRLVDTADGGLRVEHVGREEVAEARQSAEAEAARKAVGEHRSRVIALLERLDGKTFFGNQDDLRKQLEIDRTVLSNVLRELESSGRLERLREHEVKDGHGMRFVLRDWDPTDPKDS